MITGVIPRRMSNTCTPIDWNVVGIMDSSSIEKLGLCLGFRKDSGTSLGRVGERSSTRRIGRTLRLVSGSKKE